MNILCQRILYWNRRRDALGVPAAAEDGPCAGRLREVRPVHQPAQGRHPAHSGQHTVPSSVVDPHHVIADPNLLITLMRIRMRILILIFI
jgi:hypothetical protein